VIYIVLARQMALGRLMVSYRTRTVLCCTCTLLGVFKIQKSDHGKMIGTQPCISVP